MSVPIVLLFLPTEPARLAIWSPREPLLWQVTEVPDDKSRNLLETVDALLSQTQAPLDKISHIGVMAGPALYTRLRIFVATANALSWSRRLPIFEIPPTAKLPSDIVKLMATARINHVVSPIYPSNNP